MNADLSFEKQQKIALYLAAGMDIKDISEKFDVDENIIEALQNDNGFMNIVETLKADLDQNSPMIALKEDSDALQYWVRNNMITVYQSAELLEAYLFKAVESNIGSGETEELETLNPKSIKDISDAVTGVLEVKRKVLADLDTGLYKDRDLDIKLLKAKSGRDKTIVNPTDIINQRKNALKGK